MLMCCYNNSVAVAQVSPAMPTRTLRQRRLQLLSSSSHSHHRS